MPRIVIAFIIFVFLSIIVKIVRGVKRTAKILSSKKYRKNPAGTELSQDQQVALLVGAINGEQTMYYTNTIETGNPVNDTAKKLSDYYGIEDEDSAADILNWLYNEGHRGYFEAVKQVVADPDNNEYQVEEELLAAEELKEYINNLEECIESLIEHGFLKSRRDVADVSITAWDMGRLVNVTRGCFECKYITEGEAWNFINNAYEDCKKVYDNWQELAAGYIIGRAMWGGNSMSLDGLMGITAGLLSDDDSPWVQFSFK